MTHQTNVKPQVETLIRLRSTDTLLISVYCISNTDCETLEDTPVCKETVYGGSKTCQESLSCTNDCNSGEYCDASNICKEGEQFYRDSSNIQNTRILWTLTNIN